MRWLRLLSALAALALPAHAGTIGQSKALLLVGNQCAGVTLSIGFGNNTPNCYRGTLVNYGNPTVIPGWTYSGSVSGTGATVRTALNADGSVVTFANGVPRITNQGLLVEQASTNSFLNSATGVTQTITTTAASWTLSFYGTGSIVLTGGATGTLNGTGASNRVKLTVTATAAPTVLTVTGSVTSVQFEAVGYMTSYIPTTSAAVVRTADAAYVTGNFIGASPWSFQMNVTSVLASQTGANPTLAALSDGTANNYLRVYAASGGPALYGALTSSGSSIFAGQPIGSNAISTGSARAALAPIGGSIYGAATGSTGASLGTWTAFVPSRVQFGDVNASLSRPLNGYVKSVVIRSGQVSAGQLQALAQ